MLFSSMWVLTRLDVPLTNNHIGSGTSTNPLDLKLLLRPEPNRQTEERDIKGSKRSTTSSRAWPAVRLGLAAEIAALSAELAETQWLPRNELEARQWRQFRTLLQFAVRHSPYYAKRFAETGTKLEEFQSPAALSMLPLLSRQDLQAAGDDFFCKSVPKDQGKVGELQTSGSTGEPVRVKKTGISQLFLYAYALRNHAWHNLSFAARYTNIRPKRDEHRILSSWGPPFGLLYETGPAQIIPITTPLNEQLELLHEFQPETLLVYPSNLRGLVDKWSMEGTGLSALTYIKTIGETLAPELRRDVAELNPEISIIDGYSSEECGAIALQCPDSSGYHVMSESLIVEILNDADEHCAPGEIGQVVVTDLHNLASPLIRYRIGDYAQVGETCSCGRGLLKLDKILGRQRNLVVKPNGDRHWPLVGFRDFGAIAPIRQYQMIQETTERITVRFVTDEALNADHRAAFTRLIQTKLGYDFELEILDQREDIPRQPSGKYEEFVSKVATTTPQR
ncbi:MAG: phenylacetate--CoA ligase family protein [Gammaproteobacteria bacterium]|nr:MAG: phenylacetate--CoA ligase family protein [Gammaproteobacteria bacterium]